MSAYWVHRKTRTGKGRLSMTAPRRGWRGVVAASPHRSPPARGRHGRCRARLPAPWLPAAHGPERTPARHGRGCRPARADEHGDACRLGGRGLSIAIADGPPPPEKRGLRQRVGGAEIAHRLPAPPPLPHHPPPKPFLASIPLPPPCHDPTLPVRYDPGTRLARDARWDWPDGKST